MHLTLCLNLLLLYSIVIICQDCRDNGYNVCSGACSGAWENGKYVYNICHTAKDAKGWVYCTCCHPRNRACLGTSLMVQKYQVTLLLYCIISP